MSDGAVVVGASSGVGRAIAEHLARDGWDLVVAARDEASLTDLAEQLAATHGVTVTPLAVDVSGPDDDLRAFVEAAARHLPEPRAVVITVGANADDPADDDGTDPWATIDGLVATNLTGVVKLAGHHVARFEERGAGTVVLFSSIAAAAPRRRNVAYAAAKAGLESAARSFQHRLAGSGASVQLYRLGYVDTRLAAGQDLKLPKADPRKVAARVVRGLDGGSRSVHEPRWWGPIVAVLRLLPRPVYDRLDF